MNEWLKGGEGRDRAVALDSSSGYLILSALNFFFFFLVLFLAFSRAAPTAYGGSQARG